MIPFRSLFFDRPAVKERVLDLFETESGNPQPVSLFFVHGGGWRAGARAHLHTLGLAYLERGFDVASTDYRLGGVNVFDQANDVREGLRLFAEDLQRRGRPTDIVLVGSSAGAHLALMAGLDQVPAPARVAGICVQAAPYTFEPWPDIFPQIWAGMESIVGASYASSPELFRRASPIEYVRESMPPVFNLHAENEHMFPLDLAEAFIRKAAVCGARVETKTYPRVEHGFFYSLDRPQQREAFEDIVRFIGSLPASQSSPADGPR